MSTYEELKKKRAAAEKARDKAFATLHDTTEEFNALVVEHNKGLPDGWYVESSDLDNFILYLKRGDSWTQLDYNTFATPDWAEYDENDEFVFDIDVIPLSEVTW